jgi:hypothetical protein
MSCSLEVLGGAREATVEVKDFSRSNDLVRTSFVASSVFAAYLCKKRRTWATCSVKRSVGVGEDGFRSDGADEVGGGGGSRVPSS